MVMGLWKLMCFSSSGPEVFPARKVVKGDPKSHKVYQQPSVYLSMHESISMLNRDSKRIYQQMFIPLLSFLWSFFVIHGVSAIGQQTCVVFQQSSDNSTFPVVQNGVAVSVLVSPDEWPGVQRAASDFVSDIELVTQFKPTLSNASVSGTIVNSSQAIIVGTLGKSSLIDQVVNNTQLDVSSIQGLWESFLGVEVANPLPGVDNAYVIIGSDKRGTIFAMYDLSEQFGMCLMSCYKKPEF